MIHVMKNNGIRFEYINNGEFFTLDGVLHIKTGVMSAVEVDTISMQAVSSSEEISIKTLVRKVKSIHVVED